MTVKNKLLQRVLW